MWCGCRCRRFAQTSQMRRPRSQRPPLRGRPPACAVPGGRLAESRRSEGSPARRRGSPPGLPRVRALPLPALNPHETEGSRTLLEHGLGWAAWRTQSGASPRRWLGRTPCSPSLHERVGQCSRWSMSCLPRALRVGKVGTKAAQRPRIHSCCMANPLSSISVRSLPLRAARWLWWPQQRCSYSWYTRRAQGWYILGLASFQVALQTLSDWSTLKTLSSMDGSDHLRLHSSASNVRR